jgi:hypothetical protein
MLVSIKIEPLLFWYQSVVKERTERDHPDFHVYMLFFIIRCWAVTNLLPLSLSGVLLFITGSLFFAIRHQDKKKRPVRLYFLQAFSAYMRQFYCLMQVNHASECADKSEMPVL